MQKLALFVVTASLLFSQYIDFKNLLEIFINLTDLYDKILNDKKHPKRPLTSPQIYSPLHSHQKLIIKINVNLSTTGAHFSSNAPLLFKVDSKSIHS